jgi:two-component system cell cycle sensor histidine kinase/response regulator CckA
MKRKVPPQDTLLRPEALSDELQTLNLFREALENATDAIGMSTPDGRHYYQNKAFTELFGDIGDNPPATLYCDEAVGKAVFQTIMSGGQWIGEVTMYAKDHRVLNILLRAYANKDDLGNIIGLVGIYTDITARMLSEQRARAAIESSPAGMMFYHLQPDNQLIFIGANPAADKILGVDNRDFIGKPLEEAFPPLADTEIPDRYREVARTGQKWQVDEVVYDHGPIKGIYSVVAFQIQPYHMVAMFVDITERKRNEKAQRRLHNLESLGTVAGGIAHDFNNLLMGIFGNIELAQLELTPGHPALESLQAAHQALEQARHLTTRLLTFAKGGTPLLRTVDLRELICDIVRFHLAGSMVAAQFDIPQDLWPAKVDKGQIAEVIANLTINAREAMPMGGNFRVSARNIPDIHMESAPQLEGNVVQLTFQDKGVGIPDSILDRVFDPYFSTKRSGSGLGLATVHSIIIRHKGHITIESKPNTGTTVSVWLPVNGATDAAAETLQESPPIASPPSQEPRLRILLVDDEEIIRQTASHMLARAGFVVETAVEGKEALSKYAEAMQQGQPFALTIMDLTIPGGMGGAEAIKHLLALDPGAKVIVASGYSSDPVLANCTQYGFAGRLAKPFSWQELTETISRVLTAE